MRLDVRRGEPRSGTVDHVAGLGGLVPGGVDGHDPAAVDVHLDSAQVSGLLVADPYVAQQQVDHEDDPARSARAIRQVISYPSVAAASDVISAWS